MAVLVGTTIKENVSLDGILPYDMDDVHFVCEFYCYPNNVFTLSCDDMLRVDEKNYIAVVDTTGLGSGELMMRITVDVPDIQCPDGIRKEKHEVSTGRTLKR